MSEYECLNVKANQSSFARLVGVSQPAIKSHIDKGTLIPGQTLAEWLRQYCESLRMEAAGRGGDDQASLTKARTRDAEMGADLKQLQIMEKAGQLVPVAEIEPQIIAMVTAARTELLGMPNKLANEMKALHGIDIDESLIEEHIYEVLQHLANGLHENAADDDGAGVQDLGAPP